MVDPEEEAFEQLVAELRAKADAEVAALQAAQEETAQRLADVYVKDSLKTREINILTTENRAVRVTLEERTRERDEARTQFDGHVEWAAKQADAAEATLTAAQALVAKWREKARLVRPLDNDAPITAERRARIAEWMFYTNRANELEAALGSSPAAKEPT